MKGDTTFIRWTARFLCSTVIFVVGVYNVVAIAIAFFIVTGRLIPGQIMIYEENTPTLGSTLFFIGASSIAIAAAAVARYKLSGPSENAA